MKRLLWVAVLCLALPAHSYDLFDVKVCEASSGTKPKLECYRQLGISAACTNSDAEKELLCYQSATQARLRSDEASAREAEVRRPPSDTEICKAGIAFLFGQDPSIIRIDRTDGIIVSLSYRRPSDNSTWVNRCYVAGDRIKWATDRGRWRNEDEISYRVNDKQKTLTVYQVFSDGSRSLKTYPYASIRVQ